MRRLSLEIGHDPAQLLRSRLDLLTQSDMVVHVAWDPTMGPTGLATSRGIFNGMWRQLVRPSLRCSGSKSCELFPMVS